MEIIEPAKAARIMAPEPMDTDLLKKDHQKRHDQLGTGRDSQYKGPAIGLLKKVCSKNPETESAPPRMITASILGRRISQNDIIRSFISLMPEYDIQDLLHREVDTS